nr:hypothetical protein [uncultured Agathobaculum sp.]
MDFSTEFVAFRDRLLASQDKAFITSLNARVAGRAVAALSSFGLDSERKLLGVVPLGGKSHAHEYRLLFAVPVLSEPLLQDWWQYTEAAEHELVQPDENHEFSILSIIIASETIDPGVPKKLRRLAGGRDFTNVGRGWSTIRLAAVDLAGRRIYTNRMGSSLKNILNPVL